MLDIKTNKRLCDFCYWLFAACLLVILLTSCSPLAAMATSEPTAAPMAAMAPQIRTAPTPTPNPITCTIETGLQAGRVNLRTGAGVSFSVIRVLTQGEALQVIGRGAWLQVIDAQGNQGYVRAKYCQVQP